MAESEKEKLMRILDISEAEAEDIIESDKKIEQGEKLFELTAEQKAVEKDARTTGTRIQKEKKKRERKANPEKQFFISLLEKALTECDKVESFTTTNAEREIEFFSNGTKYKIVLSAPRS